MKRKDDSTNKDEPKINTKSGDKEANKSQRNNDSNRIITNNSHFVELPKGKRGKNEK